MDFITNTHGNTVPHDGGRGFCGAQWLAVSYGTVILFETVKVWQASGRPAKEAFLGQPSATPSPGGKASQEHKNGA